MTEPSKRNGEQENLSTIFIKPTTTQIKFESFSSTPSGMILHPRRNYGTNSAISNLQETLKNLEESRRILKNLEEFWRILKHLEEFVKIDVLNALRTLKQATFEKGPKAAAQTQVDLTGKIRLLIGQYL